MFPTLFGVSIIVFLLARIMPGDIVETFLAGDVNATPEQIEQTREQLGLTGSYAEQYVNWLRGIITGDLGDSPYRSTEPV